MMNRREFNRTLALATAAACVPVSLIPLAAGAAWPTEAFDAENMDDALNALYGTTETEASEAIAFKVPDIAENGAVVPISVTADIPNADHVALLVVENPSPLAATFELVNPNATTVGTRIKMGKTSPITAIVRADGKLYRAESSEIKVTIGGCGG